MYLVRATKITISKAPSKQHSKVHKAYIIHAKDKKQSLSLKNGLITTKSKKRHGTYLYVHLHPKKILMKAVFKKKWSTLINKKRDKRGRLGVKIWNP